MNLQKRMRPVFENAYDIFYDYARRRFKFINDLDKGFVLRKVGRKIRLHFAIDDFVDWWDSDISSETLESILRKETYTVAVFKWLPENSNMIKVLENLNLKPSRILHSKVFYIDLSVVNDEDKLLKALSKRRRRDLKNMINRLDKAGEWYAKIEPLSDESWKLMISWIVERFPDGHFSDDHYVSTIRKVISKLDIDFWSLTLNEKPIAYSLVIKDENVAYWYLEGFDKDFKYYSPAKVLLYRMITHYQSRNFKEFNFMKGENEYKLWWAKDYRKIYRYEFLNPNPFKRFYSFLSSIVQRV